MRRGRSLWPVALAVSISFAARADDPAAAESLFAEGQALLRKGEAAKACPKLEESQRLDPTGATAFTLARCWEELGRTASAWARYQEALAFARKRGVVARVQEIEGRLAALEKRVPKLTIDLDPSTARLPGLVVRRGDEIVGRAQWGSALAVDPGRTTLHARAPGHEDWSSTLDLTPGSELRVVVPALRPEPAVAASASSEPRPLVAPASSSPVPDSPASTAAAPRRELSRPGLALASVGVVSLGVGVYFLSRRSTLAARAEAECGSSSCGDAAYAKALETSRASGRAGTAALVALGVGSVTGGVGVYLLLRSPRETSFVPVVGPRYAGVALGARFR